MLNKKFSIIDATLKTIKNSEIKHRRFIAGQKELLNLFDLLDTIFTDKKLMSSKEENKQLKDENVNENENENENENKNEDEDDYWLWKSK